MIIKPILEAARNDVFHALRYVLCILLTQFLCIATNAEKKTNLIIKGYGDQKVLVNGAKLLVHSDTLFDYQQNLQTAKTIDTVPVGNKLKKNSPSKDIRKKTAKEVKTTTIRQSVKLSKITVTGKRRIVDSSLAILTDTILDHVNLSFNLADTVKNKSQADSAGTIFLKYIDKYYHLDNLGHIASQLAANVAIGKVNMSARRLNNIDTFSTIDPTKLLSNTDSEGHWKGTLTIDSSHFNIPSLGADYSIDTQKIILHYPGILLNNFTVQDAGHNKLVANGGIVSKSATDDELRLDIGTKNFTLLNVQKAIANQIYGFASVDASATVTGSTANPFVDGKIVLNDNSDVTIILPQNNVNKEVQNSMVRFIDKDTFALPNVNNPSRLAQTRPVNAPPLHYNFTVDASSRAALTFIIDPAAGDELRLHGEAKLKVGIDSAGGVVLAGIYKLDSGYYRLNYQFLRRQFEVLPGSTITFQGAPADALTNITAAYLINTSAQDLLGNEVGEVSPKIASTFKQDIPFRILLKLNGAIKNPQISFSIEMPDSNLQMNKTMRTAIHNKLLQLKESFAATNKQVFSLLLYNRFVGEQSQDFFKGSGTGDGGTFDDLAHESVSKFLSSALDNIAADLFKTLDVDHDIDNYRDYGSGDAQQKTDIKIGATKSFINDRSSINVGKNYGIDGQDASAKAAQQKGVGFLPDVTLNYKFTKDGKYRYKSYKKNQFEVIVDGYVTESGISFILILDYDKFSNLLKRRSKKLAD